MKIITDITVKIVGHPELNNKTGLLSMVDERYACLDGYNNFESYYRKAITDAVEETVVDLIDSLSIITEGKR